MRALVSSREMKQYDKNTIEYYGIASAVLMERAASAVFGEIASRFPKKTNQALIVCGAGNNGGDGFAAARLLHLAGYGVKFLFPMRKESMTEETKAQYHAVKQYGIPEVSEVGEEPFDIVVDALFGIGLSRAIEGDLGRLIDSMGQSVAYKIAIDMPSGISADTGQALGCAFRADLTVTFGFAKIGQLLYPGAEYTGELVVADIGIDENSFLGQKPFGSYGGISEMGALLPGRSAYSNKGSYGKTLIVAGSAHMAGAAYFAAKAAYYSGCGLVRILTPNANREILLTKLPEAIITTYDPKEQNKEELLQTLDDCVRWADAVLIGPGIGTDETARLFVSAVLSYQKKTALDADALNILSGNMALLEEAKGELAVTPHLGEMSSLTGKSIADIQSGLIREAGGFAKKYNAVCVLKDARTVVGMPNGEFFVNTSGNHGMATGGSGDVLAGFLAGFLAQGMECGKAGILAVCLHGAAGDFAAEEKGPRGLLASDILEKLPQAIRAAEQKRSPIK